MQNQRKTEKFLSRSGDMLLLAVCFLVAAYLAKRHAGIAAGFLQLGRMEIIFLFLLFPTWGFATRMFRLYDESPVRSLRREWIALGQTILLLSFAAMVFLFAAKSQALSRFFLFLFFILLLPALLLWKMALTGLLFWMHKNGCRLSPVLIVGGGEVAGSFASLIAANPRLGFKVAGFVAEQPHPDHPDAFLGTIEKLPQVLERNVIDEVVIALPNSMSDQVVRIIEVCENFPVRVRIIPDYLKFLSARFSISRFGAFPIVTLRAHPLEMAHWRFFKRCFDLLGTLLLFIGIFSWLWPLLALLIKVSSPGPVFFKQERWGEKNRRILCWKFRSMVRESRDVDENGRYQQATHDDPRVTSIGRFLRRNNLDELPQFINVLKGEMSVVGPRPHPTPMNLEVKDTIQHYQMRHLIKPGITGWAQVKGFRGETSDPKMLRRRIEADLWYIENWSFPLDLKIIALTFWVMLKGDAHAY